MNEEEIRIVEVGSNIMNKYFNSKSEQENRLYFHYI